MSGEQMAGSQVFLRPAEDSDFESVLKIENQSYPNPWSKEHFKTEAGKPFSQFLVAEDHLSHVVGYLVFWVMFDECSLVNVSVAPEHRRKGVGRALMNHLLQFAKKKKLKKVVLEVRESNSAAIKLYENFGFFKEHVRENFYEDGENACFMSLFIDYNSQL